jgi:hypothetical protein
MRIFPDRAKAASGGLTAGTRSVWRFIQRAFVPAGTYLTTVSVRLHRGRLLCKRVGTVGVAGNCFWYARVWPMAHWRKRNPPAYRFNAYLKGWALAFSASFGRARATLACLVLSGRGELSRPSRAVAILATLGHNGLNNVALNPFALWARERSQIFARAARLNR